MNEDRPASLWQNITCAKMNSSLVVVWNEVMQRLWRCAVEYVRIHYLYVRPPHARLHDYLLEEITHSSQREWEAEFLTLLDK